MRSFVRITLIALLLVCSVAVNAQEESETPKREGMPPLPEVDIPEISDEELMAIINRADNFFADQGIENMAVDLDIFRDPSRQLTIEDMKSGEVDIKAVFSPIIAHYFYQPPGWYQLKIMGILVATSEPGVATYTHLLPLPGGQVNIPLVIDNYDLIYMGYGEFNNRKTHKIRLAAKDFKNEFIKYSIYEFDVEKGYLCTVSSHFDNGYWRGHGSGEFYYIERGGKLLPGYGYGEILILPFFKTALWGRWYNWEFNSDDFEMTKSRGADEAFVPIIVDNE